MKSAIIELLKEKKVKITNERKAIISVLEDAKAPLSPADIFLKISPNLPKANLTTVYRNLEMLKGLNLVKPLSFNKSSFFYELVSNRQHHHHAVCTCCGKVEDLKNISEKFVNDVSKATKFKIEDHNLEFFGLCETCSEESNES
jgi:Fe2+ or Zn2+ uptake regulation protein